MLDADSAYEEFEKLRRDFPIEDDDKAIADNECATRLWIDRMLTDVLGWPKASLRVEQPAGDQKRADYIIEDGGKAWLVIEAKKRDHQLILADEDPQLRAYKLTGPVLKTSCWPIISDQMPPYLGRYRPAIGMLCNGEQWVAFLFHSSEHLQPLEESRAIVFRSLSHIAQHFERFFQFFSYPKIHQQYLKQYLLPRQYRGTFPCQNPYRVFDYARPVPFVAQNMPFHEALKWALQRIFKPIPTDALEHCFVTSRESKEAAEHLARMTNQLGEPLLDAARDYPRKVEGETQQFDGAENLKSLKEETGFLARIIGEPSSGKSVFLKRFFDIELEKRQRDLLILVFLDMEKLGIEPEEISTAAFEAIKDGLFGDEGPTDKDYRELYKKEWQRYKRLLGGEDAHQDKWASFVSSRIEQEEARPREALERYANFALLNRRRLPCFILDNIDHLDAPHKVLNWATSIFLSIYGLVTVNIEDGTLWRIRTAGQDLMEKQQPEQFWLYRPKVREIIENRCKYLTHLIEQGANPKLRVSALIGRNNQFKWLLDKPTELTRVITKILLEDQKIANWLGEIANYYIAEVFTLCRAIVLSPHVKAEDLFRDKITEQVKVHRVLKALISPRHEQFEPKSNRWVTNVLSYWQDQEWAPLLPFRILALLKGKEDDDRNTKEQYPGLMLVREITRLFYEHTGVETRISQALLQQLATMALIEPFNPSEKTILEDTQIKVTPRGKLHLDWTLEHETYLRMMAEVDPIVDQAVGNEISQRHAAFLNSIKESATWSQTHNLELEIVRIYVAYLIGQSEQICPLSDNIMLGHVRTYQDKLTSRWIATQG